VQVIVHQVEAAEVDEMWSFVGSKHRQRWLWHAIDHRTGQVLAYVFGTREDETFLRLQELLAPFGITHFYTDGWEAYRRHIDPDKHTVGETAYAKDRTPTHHAACPDHMLGTEDHLFFQIHPNA
jgi:insertion element IS1 protein InsB